MSIFPAIITAKKCKVLKHSNAETQSLMSFNSLVFRFSSVLQSVSKRISARISQDSFSAISSEYSFCCDSIEIQRAFSFSNRFSSTFTNSWNSAFRTHTSKCGQKTAVLNSLQILDVKNTEIILIDGNGIQSYYVFGDSIVDETCTGTQSIRFFAIPLTKKFFLIRLSKEYFLIC